MSPGKNRRSEVRTMNPSKVLCVCVGNSDRSPLMARVLELYLRNAGIPDLTVESAGTHEVASYGGHASSFMIKAARRIGIDLSGHRKRQVTQAMLEQGQYDLFVVVDSQVAEQLLVVAGFGDLPKVCNAEVVSPWPSQFQEDYDATAGRILATMYRVVVRYFSSEE